MAQNDLRPTQTEDDEAVNPRLIFAFSTICALLMLGLWLYPRGPYLTIVSNPFAAPLSIAAITNASDSQFIASGRFGWIANIYGPHDDAAARLYSAGALIVVRNYAPSTCLQEVKS